MALRSRAGRAWSAHFPLVVPARFERNLFFSFLLAGISDSRTDRSARNSPCGFLPSSCRSCPGTLGASLVCAHHTLVFRWARDIKHAVLGRHGGLCAVVVELV